MSDDIENETAPGPYETPEGPPTDPHRVWPVFVGFVFVLGAVLIGGIALAVVLVVREDGGLPPAGVLESRLGAVVVSAPALIGSVLLSVSLLSIVSLVGAGLSAQPFRERLRLQRLRVPLLAYPVSVLGLLVIGQSVEYLAVWLGFGENMAALQALARAVSEMPQTSFLVFLLLGSLGAGVAEELFFRGYMQTRLKSRFGVVAALFVSSLAFGILHLDPVHATLAFFMGLYLGWLADLGGSIALPIVAHVGNNFVAFLATRFTESTIGAPAPYFALSAALAVLCVWALTRLLARVPA